MTIETQSQEKTLNMNQTQNTALLDSEFSQNGFKSKNSNGGPYSKKDRESRIENVCTLHFEYGYSAKKISELLGVNRNTVNDDIKKLYENLEENWKNTSTLTLLQNNLESLFAQKRRLREELDKTEKFSEKLAIEKMIFQIESKINQFQLRKGTYGIHKSI